jgi:hypothetical protein
MEIGDEGEGKETAITAYICSRYQNSCMPFEFKPTLYDQRVELSEKPQ